MALTNKYIYCMEQTILDLERYTSQKYQSLEGILPPLPFVYTVPKLAKPVASTVACL